jgi:lipopolysaccharide/colanic/teichoic acid biosynthesis glycosyltransferase
MSAEMHCGSLPASHPGLVPGTAVRTSGCGRGFDVVCAIAGLLLLWPVLLLVALLILILDGWPVFFRQARVGLGGKLFRIWKFRTMRTEAPGAEGPLVTAAGDPRITRFGRWLRTSKLDELPQLINVLVGEMSVIGPRPEVPRYVNLEDPVWQAVLAVRPGITDLATLAHLDEERTLFACDDPESYYRETILPGKLALNVKYLQLKSWRTDVRLILLTLQSILHLGCRGQGWIREFLSTEIAWQTHVKNDQ